ncbi:MAG: glycosyltransferase family 2 protein [Myxococcaceae bacterium]
MVAVLFWCSTLLLLHTYFFYPLLIIAIDGVASVAQNLRYLVQGEDRRRARRSLHDLPQVSLVVAAYNEASCVGQKLFNSLALDYPMDRLEVLVGSDGSTDRTNEIVLASRDPRVKLSNADRGGKTTVLNRCIPMATGDIVVLTDANTQLDEQAIKKLVRHFADPTVGAVCGRLKLYNPTKHEYEESAYWTYESLIKFYEGKRGAVMGANGGLYAIRRALFRRLPSRTIVDDFVIPLRILERGYKVVYEPEAVAFEETTEDYGREFGRRARIAAGNFQSLALIPSLLSPTRGFAAFAFWSHKVLRWCAPALMAITFAANVALLPNPLYIGLLAAQMAFYALAIAGRARLFHGGLRRMASVAYYFVTMNAAIVVGFWRFLRNSQRAAWERTARAL